MRVEGELFTDSTGCTCPYKLSESASARTHVQNIAAWRLTHDLCDGRSSFTESSCAAKS